MGYYGLMRIGELVHGDHTLKARDVHIACNKNKILIILYSSKTHGQESQPQRIKFTEAQCTSTTFKKPFFCPFAVIREYLSIRGNFHDDNEHFFVFANRLPILQCTLRNLLKRLLKLLNLDSKAYSVHSMHLGRASDLMKYGMSIEYIKHVDRWKSNEVYRYLKFIQ